MAREISRWDPFREVTSLRDEIDRLFDSFFGRQTSMGPREGFWVPPLMWKKLTMNT